MFTVWQVGRWACESEDLAGSRIGGEPVLCAGVGEVWVGLLGRVWGNGARGMGFLVGYGCGGAGGGGRLLGGWGGFSVEVDDVVVGGHVVDPARHPM